ncbi:MAG: oligosaccharide flippase family protein [Flavobacteriaceae bacterium]
MRLCLSGISFITGILLARLLGPGQFGIYSLVIAWASFLTIPSIMGLRPYVVREIAAAEACDDGGGKVRETYRVAINTISISLLIVVSASLFVFYNYDEILGIPFEVLVFAIIPLPLLAFDQIRQAVFQGMRRTALGLFPEACVQGLLFLLLVAVFWCVVEDLSMDSSFALYLRNVAILGSYLVGFFFVLKISEFRSPKSHAVHEKPSGVMSWFKAAPPFMLMALSHMISQRVGVMLLGALCTPESVGVFTVALRGAELCAFPLMAINAVAAPVFAQLKHAKDVEIRKTYLKYCCYSTLASWPLILGLIIFGVDFVALFGSSFKAAYIPLVIICCGQVVNVATGPAIILLIMIGGERIASRIILASGVLYIIASIALIPRMQEVGAAISTAAFLMIQNMVVMAYIFRRVK